LQYLYNIPFLNLSSGLIQLFFLFVNSSSKISKDIDKKYYENFIQAKKKGVKFLCYSSKVTDKEIILNKKIEIKY
jgi:DNA-binding sugar fermentation-stimulating protein